MNQFDFIVIGGGASGFFAAINAKLNNPQLKVIIIEKNRECLQKVKVSGGGRCNVTNGQLDPDELVKNYPRGNDFLKEPFKKFGSKQTMDWFERQGVKLKIESDNRVFPVSNSSESIINCFLNIALKNDIKVFNGIRVEKFSKAGDSWEVQCKDGQVFKSKKLMIATGSDSTIWSNLRSFGYEIIEPVPSLFTFNIKDKVLHELKGLSIPQTNLEIPELKLSSKGPTLITHWGLSGPAVLRLSAWGAILLSSKKYNTALSVNWIPEYTKDEILTIFKNHGTENPKKQIKNTPLFGVPLRFWEYVCAKSGISNFQNWAESGKKTWLKMLETLTKDQYAIEGKSTFKEEFVTAGGISLHQVNSENFESKIHPGLFFAGEVLNIDAITGGFNFQAAWTGAYLIAKAI